MLNKFFHALHFGRFYKNVSKHTEVSANKVAEASATFLAEASENLVNYLGY